MSQLPPVVWLVAAAAALLLLAACAAIGYAVLRAASRRRIARWSARRLTGLGAAAALPWLVVWLAPIRITGNIHTAGALVGWLLVAALAFAALVLLPIAALLSGAVWWTARRRRGAAGPPAA